MDGWVMMELLTAFLWIFGSKATDKKNSNKCLFPFHDGLLVLACGIRLGGLEASPSGPSTICLPARTSRYFVRTESVNTTITIIVAIVPTVRNPINRCRQPHKDFASKYHNHIPNRTESSNPKTPRPREALVHHREKKQYPSRRKQQHLPARHPSRLTHQSRQDRDHNPFSPLPSPSPSKSKNPAPIPSLPTNHPNRPSLSNSPLTYAGKSPSPSSTLS